MGGTLQYELLDEAGHKTGKLMDATEVHKQELWHEVSNVWIVNKNGDVLLQLRAPDVELCPGVWDVAVGTHVRPGEEPQVAAVRGLATELGITVLPENLQHLFNIQAANHMQNGTTHKVLGHVFLLKQDVDMASMKIDKDHISQISWQPMVKVMADIGGTETKAQYFPREGTYYPQLFDALMAQAPPEMTR